MYRNYEIRDITKATANYALLIIHIQRRNTKKILWQSKYERRAKKKSKMIRIATYTDRNKPGVVRSKKSTFKRETTRKSATVKEKI